MLMDLLADLVDPPDRDFHQEQDAAFVNMRLERLVLAVGALIPIMLEAKAPMIAPPRPVPSKANRSSPLAR